MSHQKLGMIIGAVIASFFILLAELSHAQGQVPCGKREDIVATLEKKYGEVQRGYGLSGNVVMEFFHGETTWTILRTTPTGVSCVMATGYYWQDIPPKIQGDPT